MITYLQAHAWWGAFALLCLVVVAVPTGLVRYIVRHWYADEPERHPVWWHTDPEGVPWDGAAGADFEAAADMAWADELHAINTDLPGPDPLRSLRPVNGDPGETAGSLRAGELHRDIWQQLHDDPALIEWDLHCQVERLRQHEIAARCQVTEIRRIRSELADLRKELCAA